VVAERIATLGASPSGQVQHTAVATSLQPLPLGFLPDGEVVELVTDRIRSVATDLRGRMKPIEDADPVTADLLHEIVGDLEKQHWMLRSQLG
jgi:starvation-inducible DNA-binding protein